MSKLSGETASPIRSIDDLLAPFLSAEKPRSQWRVGTEAESFGLDANLQPLAFRGPNGLQALFESLQEDYGWLPVREYADGEVIALKREQFAITLEPGGQLELSSAPYASLEELDREHRRCLQEVLDISRTRGLHWIALGFHPFARQADLPWIPKTRYGIMKRYLPTRGGGAWDMMRRTATVQANLDFDSEEDALRKLRVSLALQPIVTALFANSPWREGTRAESLSLRAQVWLQMDPDRTGLLPQLWRSSVGYRDYVEWALDAPMFLIRRNDQVFESTQQTFRSFMRDGFRGLRAEPQDWELHLNTLFPETRLKRTLEVRGADSQSTERLLALAAWWKGLLYSPRALAKAEFLVESIDAPELQRSRAELATRALQAKVCGRSALEWAQDALGLAKLGLEEIAELEHAATRVTEEDPGKADNSSKSSNLSGLEHGLAHYQSSTHDPDSTRERDPESYRGPKSESVLAAKQQSAQTEVRFLEPIVRLLEQAQCPAQELLSQLPESTPDHERLVQLTELSA